MTKKSFDYSSDKTYFEPVDQKVDFPSLEKKILDDWDKKQIVKKYLDKNMSSTKIFSFLDGPITANNPMGVHHAWGRTYKDIFQRYKNMQGFKERFQNGFDCQGLWVEVEVEKELGLKSKKDIENLVPGDKKASIAKFISLCKERAQKYANIQRDQSERLGYFMDWNNSYYTLSDENNYMIWHFLAKCHENNLIYKGYDTVPWCPRCGTAISQHEILTESYGEVTHDSVYIKYPILGKKNEFLLVWTTTPWTLPANVAVAVDVDKVYVKTVKDNNNIFYLLENVAKQLNLNIDKKIKGSGLIGFKYESPFDSLPRIKKALENYQHQVISTDKRILEISEEEGTGLVHIAPSAGEEDFQLGKKLSLPLIEVIDEEANYMNSMDEFSTKNAKKHPEIILDYLKTYSNGKFLFDIVPVKHRYPVCWRCATELVWRTVDEWYIAMDRILSSSQDKGKTLRKKMIEVAKKIKWIPSFGLERELDWLNNMHDWLISKKRYWGLALPIWECKKCGFFEVVESRDDLKNKAVEGWEKFNGHTPHKPWIDEVKIKCPQCKGLMGRIPDVGNPWLDAGIVSFSTITKNNIGQPLYWNDRKEWEKWYPADFITESFPGQFKNWFYSLIAMSTVLENKEPFKEVLGFATLLAEDGRPMHKSWGNSIEFNEAADKIGVDVMRWMYAKQNPTENLLFGYHVADETRRRFHLKLWNIYNFFVTYSNIDGWTPDKDSKIKNQNISILDKWILIRLGETIEKVTKSVDKYDVFTASNVLEEFVDDLSNWYIRRSRERVGPSAEDGEDKLYFYQTSYFVLVNLAKILAIFTPFISEEIYRNLTKEVSIHLSDWPTPKLKIDNQNLKLLEQMKLIREVVEKVHGSRKEAKISVKQPLTKVTFYGELSNTREFEGQLLQLAQEELNIKTLEFKKGKARIVLDTNITRELEEEAKARELIRMIQDERKNMGLKLTQKTLVSSSWLPKNPVLLGKIQRKTLSKLIEKKEFKVEVLKEDNG